MQRYRVGIIGATGMVGQRFVLLLHNHPWFQVTCLAASSRSAGLTYREAVAKRWAFPETPIPDTIAEMTVLDASDVDKVAEQVDFVFCAVDMKKDETLALEERYAKAETPVVSNNSASRMLPDVPMMIPEINGAHAAVIEAQRARLGTKRGFIAVKPNCSIQSYVPALWPLLEFEPQKVIACTYQAISGAGKTFASWPEMVDNVIPYIPGEDEKSEREPMKIFGHVENGKIISANAPTISAQCLRVACTDGHMAAVSVKFGKKPTMEQILERWVNCRPATEGLGLPSSPEKFLYYFDDPSRPQTRLDRDFEHGMGITLGRLREDAVFDYKFVCLSHNTLRGAAGGGVLSAEYLCRLGYIQHKQMV
jgi:aspartate-semialdehyde dehydrogenase